MTIEEEFVEFVECFLARGWRGIERNFGFSTNVNRKLMERIGRDRLLAERAAVNRSGNTGRTGRKAGKR